MNAAILLTAGRSSRMRESVDDKILYEVGGCTLFAKSLLAFREAAVANLWIVTYRDQSQKEILASEASKMAPEGVEVILVKGGEERRHKVQPRRGNVHGRRRDEHDEAAHADMAQCHGARPLPWVVTSVMRLLAQVMKSTAYYV